MAANTITINKIPSPTWNRLNMNEVQVDVASVCPQDDDIVVRVPDEIDIRVEASDYASDISGALGTEFEEKLKQSTARTEVFAVSQNIKCENPVIISAEFKKECAGGKRYLIEAEKGSEITVLADFSSEDGVSGRGCMQTLIRAKEGSKVHLVQIDRMGGSYELLNDVGAVAEKEASIEIVHIFLGGKNIYQGCNIDLQGEGASVKKDIGYFLKGEQNLDMNYIVLHKGEKTHCDIKASGVLEGTSSKLFRGTIDFRDGCSGSKGAEIEEVILRDDTVINKTIPVILCAEEDVEGSHGATIGRLDEDLIFYMQTRGFEEEEIYKLISKSRLLSFCSRIPDDEIRNKTMTF